MPLKIIKHASADYAKMLALRNDILRKPLGLVLAADDMKDEHLDILIAAFDDDEMLGCCVLKKLKNGVVYLRQMAVKSHLQGKGIGSSLIHFAENIVRDNGYMEIKMDARANSVGFYERHGYTIENTEFLKLGIPHYVMRKIII